MYRNRVLPLVAGIVIVIGFGQTPAPIQQLALKIISVRPHDTRAYTEGLVWQDGALYESAGNYNESDLRQIDPKTGEILHQVKLADQYFGEGLAFVDGKLIQLTWKENTAFEYDAPTFDRLRTFNYEGEGWGLCYDGTQLYMSNGTHTITARDPQTFEVMRAIQVTADDQPVEQINELECADDSIYANVWLTDQILKIDKKTGQVMAVVDASGLLTDTEKAAAGSAGVLNGIAYDPVQKTFLITGKNWPHLFEVQFVPSTTQ